MGSCSGLPKITHLAGGRVDSRCQVAWLFPSTFQARDPCHCELCPYDCPAARPSEGALLFFLSHRGDRTHWDWEGGRLNLGSFISLGPSNCPSTQPHFGVRDIGTSGAWPCVPGMQALS